MNNISSDIINQLRNAINVNRLVETAMQLVEVPSPTGNATDVSNRLEEILRHDGFEVERPEAGWPKAPAVVGKLTTGETGKTLQFNGHLDTVHLPFVAPKVENGMLYGSGASDMKGGIAAAVEAMRVLKQTGLLKSGSILLTGHDLHEAPWGDGSHVDGLIDAGYIGDAVLLPEYCADRLGVIGRGLAILGVKITRDGEPIHEVLGGIEQPSVILAGAEVLRRFHELDNELANSTHPVAGRESIFIGSAHGGEIYNQSPVLFEIAGTRRWLPGNSVREIEQSFHELLNDVARQTGTSIAGDFCFVRDAFELDTEHPFVDVFGSVCEAVMGDRLPLDGKPFVDDGNTFSSRGKIPAITHGPAAKGAHTLNEEVSIAELERVALVYAATAVAFCNE